jgi:hypothetical protein
MTRKRLDEDVTEDGLTVKKPKEWHGRAVPGGLLPHGARLEPAPVHVLAAGPAGSS